MKTVLNYSKNYAKFYKKLKKNIFFYPKNINELISIIKNNKNSNKNFLCVGEEKSWHDTVLNSENYIIKLSKFKKKIQINRKKKFVSVSSNVKLNELINKLDKYNYVINNIPGYFDITIGGCVSNDVHGKDSFKNGTFANNIIELTVLLSNNKIVKCSKKNNYKIFSSVIGGLGLIGIIIDIKLKILQKARNYLTEQIKCSSYIKLIKYMFKNKNDYDYIVAWIDSYAKNEKLGRGIVYKSKSINTLSSPKKKFLIFNSKLIKLRNFLIRIIFKINLTSFLNFFFYFIHSKKNLIQSRNQIINPLSNNSFDFAKIIEPNSFLELQIIIPKKKLFLIKRFLELTQKLKIKGLLIGAKIHKKSFSYLSFSDDGISININCICSPLDKEKIKNFVKLYDFIYNNNLKVFLCKDFFLKKNQFLKIYPNSKKFLKLKEIVDKKKYFMSDFYRRIS